MAEGYLHRAAKEQISETLTALSFCKNCATERILTDAGDLDAWFPRDAAAPVAPPAPEQGVIAGVKRDAPKRYAHAWYRGLKRDDAPEGDI